MTSRKYECDGHCEPINSHQLVPGNVLRFINHDGSLDTFSDSVVVKIDGDEITLGRPHLSLTSEGEPTLQAEYFQVYRARLIARWQIVVQSTGEPALHRY